MSWEKEKRVWKEEKRVPKIRWAPNKTKCVAKIDEQQKQMSSKEEKCVNRKKKWVAQNK